MVLFRRARKAAASARSTYIDVTCQARMMRNLPRFLPKSPWNSARLLAERVAQDPTGLGLLYEDQKFTWREIDYKVNQYARYFQSLGIGKGDTVALMMDNRPEFVYVVTALNRLRALSALINTNISGKGLVHAIKVSEPKAVVTGSEHAKTVLAEVGKLEEIPADRRLVQMADPGKRAPKGLVAINAAVDEQSTDLPSGLSEPTGGEPMCYIYTSGTTGLPKAAIIANRRWVVASYMFGSSLMDASSKDVIYCSLPLYHSSAMFAGWGAALSSGAALGLRRKFSASQFWDDVHRFDASVVVYIGELCRYLLNQPPHPRERSHRLRLATGNGLRPDIWKPFQDRFAVPLVREFYGATEGNAPIINFEGRPGMIGRVRPGQCLLRCDQASGEPIRNAQGFCEQVKPGETGLLVGKITKVMTFDGYVDKEATKKKILGDVFEKGDQFFNSGDLIQMHGGGWLSFADRVGDTFRWKGENVSTNEVAEVLNGASGVLESNVYGVKVEGADGRAGMGSLNCDASFSTDEFARYVVDKLPVYQRPYFLRIQQDMRITGTFKHQKVDYRSEGFDPSKVKDPLYFLDGDTYVPIDDNVYSKIQKGEMALR